MLMAAGLAGAGDVAPAGAGDIEQMKRELGEQRKALEAQQRALEEQENRLAAQKRALQETQRRLEGLQSQLGGPVAPSPEKTARTESQEAPQTVGRAPEKPKNGHPPEIAPIFEQPGVLTEHGKFVLEPSLQYSYSSNNRVALVGYTVIPALTVGLIDVRTVNRSTFIGALTARYGVTNRLEVEAKMPYVYRSDSTVTRPFNSGSAQDSVFNADGNGLGDIEFAARYQFNDGGADRPYYIGGLRVKTRTGKDPFEVEIDPATNLQRELPTGSGFVGVQPSLTVIYPSDPAVFFGGINYLANIKRNGVEPGNAFGFNFGMGLALNEKASFSVGYDHTIIERLKQNGVFATGATTTQLASLLFGYSYRVSNDKTVNLSLGAGLTKDTPDLQLTLRVPFSF